MSRLSGCSRRIPGGGLIVCYLYGELCDGRPAAVVQTEHLRVVHSLFQHRLLRGQVLAVISVHLTPAELHTTKSHLHNEHHHKDPYSST